VTIRGGAGPLTKLEREDSAGNDLLELQPDDDGVITRDVAVTAGSRLFVRLRAPRKLATSYLADLALS
jgi:hypothetical protein